MLILSDKMLPKQGNAEHNFVLTIHFTSTKKAVTHIKTLEGSAAIEHKPQALLHC